MHPGFELAAVWERSRKIAAATYPEIRSYDTLEALLADDSIELVVVNTPNYTHYEYAKAALLAGKQVLVEKPFVTTVAEGEELCAIAEERGLVLAVYHNRRWDSDLLLVKDVVDAGLLGPVVEAAFHFDRFKAELNTKQHKETPGPGTGILFDLGSHLIDSALHVFGYPQAVYADLRILRPGSEVDDDFELWLYYPGLRVRLHAGYYVREAPPSFQVFGRTGALLKPRGDVQERQLLEGMLPDDPDFGYEEPGTAALLHRDDKGVPERRHVSAWRGDYMAFFEGLHSALRHNGAAPVSGREGLAVIRVIEAAFRSSEIRAAVSLE
ncbi:MAG: oxidoreductase [Chitinophagaceae bacterium]|nr:MAG: oxidoreductase [Chitinophagaceae bacterium]